MNNSKIIQSTVQWLKQAPQPINDRFSAAQSAAIDRVLVDLLTASDIDAGHASNPVSLGMFAASVRQAQMTDWLVGLAYRLYGDDQQLHAVTVIGLSARQLDLPWSRLVQLLDPGLAMRWPAWYSLLTCWLAPDLPGISVDDWGLLMFFAMRSDWYLQGSIADVIAKQLGNSRVFGKYRLTFDQGFVVQLGTDPYDYYDTFTFACRIGASAVYNKVRVSDVKQLARDVDARISDPYLKKRIQYYLLG